MKKIGIIGSRKRNIRTDFMKVKDAFFKVYEEGDWIVSGGCEKGGDLFAETLARMFGIPILILHARWNHKWNEETKKFDRTYIKAAGFIRNTPIAEHSDILIACVQDDRIGGAEDTITKFEKMEKTKLILV